MFELHVVQALRGDCLLLVYGPPRQPHYMLIDGGPATVYANHLRPVLANINAGGGRLERVVLTHTDDDHVIGLVDLFAELRSRQLQKQPPLIPVDGTWMNSFAFDAVVAPSMANISIPLPPSSEREHVPLEPALPMPVSGVEEGIDLRQLLDQLRLPINSGFPGDLVSLETAPAPDPAAGLQLTIIGPTKSNLERMGREWREWVEERRLPEGVAAAPDLSKPVSPDQSIPNRSSVMFVAEYEGRSILFTADGRASDVTRGLIRCGLMKKDGVFHVDVLMVPHHGSARNASREFFSQVTADTYVFSANGTNGNPDLHTLVWLVESLKEQRRNAHILATNLTPSLEELLREFPPALYGYDLEVLPSGEHALPISLC